MNIYDKLVIIIAALINRRKSIIRLNFKIWSCVKLLWSMVALFSFGCCILK